MASHCGMRSPSNCNESSRAINHFILGTISYVSIPTHDSDKSLLWRSLALLPAQAGLRELAQCAMLRRTGRLLVRDWRMSIRLGRPKLMALWLATHRGSPCSGRGGPRDPPEPAGWLVGSLQRRSRASSCARRGRRFQSLQQGGPSVDCTSPYDANGTLFKSHGVAASGGLGEHGFREMIA